MKRNLWKLNVGEALVSSSMNEKHQKEIMGAYIKHGIRRAVRKKRALGYF